MPPRRNHWLVSSGAIQRELAKLCTLQALHDSAMTRIQHLTRENSLLTASLESMRLEDNRLRAAKGALEEEVSAITPLQERTTELQGELNVAMSQLECARNDLQRERVEWQTLKDTHELELRSLRFVLSQANASARELQDNFDTLSHTHTEVSEQLAESRSWEQGTNTKLSALRLRYKQDIDAIVAERSAHMELLKASLLSESSAHSAAQRQLASCTHNLDSALSDLEASRRLVELGKEARDATLQELQHTQTRMLKATASVTRLQDELTEIAQQLLLAQRQRAEAAATSEKLKSQLMHAEHDASVAQLKHKDALREEHRKLVEAVEELQRDADEFEMHLAWLGQACMGKVHEVEGKACEHVKELVYQSKAAERCLIVLIPFLCLLLRVCFCVILSRSMCTGTW